MSSEVKHYWPEELVGTGELVVYLTDYAALEAELSKLRAGQEPVAWAAQNVSSGKYGYIWHEESDVRGWINLQHQSDNSTWRGPIALYTTPQPSAVPDGLRAKLAEGLDEITSLSRHLRHGGCDSTDLHGLEEGLTHAIDMAAEMLSVLTAAAPSAPATVQGVNQQLLEALENTATWIEQLPVPTVGAAGQLVKIDKAITAAR